MPKLSRMKALLSMFSAFLLFMMFCGADETTQIVAANPTLSSDDLNLMDKAVHYKGKKKEIGVDVAAKLGLPSEASVIPMIGVKEPDTGFVHVYGHFPNGELCFSFLNLQSAFTYRVSPNLKIISCICMTSDVASSIVYPDQSFGKELLWWKNECKLMASIKWH